MCVLINPILVKNISGKGSDYSTYM